MKLTLLAILATALLGLAVGVGSSFYRYGQRQAVYGFSKPRAIAVDHPIGPQPVLPSQSRARAVVQGDSTYDFGIMSRNERRSHTFSVRNQGTADLTVAFLDKSCQCTDVTLSRLQVPPGETTEITLTWQPSTFHQEFQQTARFQTNDPSRIELDLTVKGKVQQVVQTVPRALSFDNVTVGQARELTFHVFGYRDPDLAVDRIETLDAATADSFATEVEPLRPDELASEAGAVAGARIRVQLKPGMPLGRFDQRLRVHLNHADLGPLDVPVLGNVVGNLTLAGPGYNPRLGIWDLGTLSGDREHDKSLWIFVKGEQAESIRMKIASVDPDDVLEAEIVPPADASKLAKHTLHLHIRPRGGVVNRLGFQQGALAEVVLETTDPEIPTIRIPVALAIESSAPAAANSHEVPR